MNASEHKSYCPSSRKLKRVVTVLCTLSFGFTGAPAIHNPVARAPTHVARACAPLHTVRDGPDTFDVLTKTDDHVMCEPNLGLRLSIAAEVLEDSMRCVAGHDVVAVDKLEYNGHWDARQIVWGSEVDVDELTVALPLEKRIKAMYTVFDEVYDPGNRCVPLVELQRLQGSCNHWAEIQPALKPYLPRKTSTSHSWPQSNKHEWNHLIGFA